MNASPSASEAFVQVLADRLLETGKAETPEAAWHLLSRLRHQLTLLQDDELQQVLGDLPPKELQALAYDWQGVWARDSQLPPPGDWLVWLVLAGRGYGKTRTGAETVRNYVERGLAGRIGLIAPTAADAREVMVEGESGILACSPPWMMPRYEPSKRRLTWPNGARATCYSAEEPERLRGPQHDLIWGDEPASWLGPPGHEGMPAWNMAIMGLRLGRPRAIVTGTPKPVGLVLRLLKQPGVVVTRGSTYENSANLAQAYLEEVRRAYEGTRLGRQEIYAEVLLDVAGALFQMEWVDRARVPFAPQLDRVVVAVDPAPTSEHGSDETGIVVVGSGAPPEGWVSPLPGRSDHGPHAYVLEDCTCKGSPDAWARAAVLAYYRHRADCIVAEINMGGEMVESTIRSIDPNVNFKAVRAMRGKAKRAEPVAAAYEQGRVHHVGVLERLEQQQRVFTGVNGKRDDRTDANNWGIHELLLGDQFVLLGGVY